MGSGKSTIGPILANTIGYNFVDLDLFIEQQKKRKIGDIFKEEGEKAFQGNGTNISQRGCRDSSIRLFHSAGEPLRIKTRSTL